MCMTLDGKRIQIHERLFGTGVRQFFQTRQTPQGLRYFDVDEMWRVNMLVVGQ